ncbi:hypothetical protein [Kitasatospora purpeofusca]|uniref:hypothetical protein n=1 Tax=Kitasatospora purpeofusca TaxID=67352 RepID=UPI00368A7254
MWRTEGCAGTSSAGLAEAAGAAQGGLYLFFDSRWGVVRQGAGSGGPDRFGIGRGIPLAAGRRRKVRPYGSCPRARVERGGTRSGWVRPCGCSSRSRCPHSCRCCRSR